MPNQRHKFGEGSLAIAFGFFVLLLFVGPSKFTQSECVAKLALPRGVKFDCVPIGNEQRGLHASEFIDKLTHLGNTTPKTAIG